MCGRSPAAAFVLGHDKLAATATPRLTTLLTALPGLYAYQETATGEPSVVDPRGFTANGLSSYLKVLLDGQETRDLENGNVDWDWLVPEDAERVEIVQGPGAWAYGDGAEGGILNIVRARPAPGTSARSISCVAEASGRWAAISDSDGRTSAGTWDSMADAGSPMGGANAAARKCRARV